MKSGYLPKSQVVWPEAARFSRVFTKEFTSDLAQLTESHAEPELFDHFFLYKDNQPIIEWPDAFSNVMWISSLVPEKIISEFSAKIGVTYKYINEG